MKKRYINATLIDNIPYCECGSPAGHVLDYYGAKVGEEGYTGFIRFCSNTKCRNLLVYYVETTLNENIRYVYDKEDVTILREK